MIRLATEGRPLWHNPAQSRVLAGLAHLADLPRRRAALAQLQRAGRRRCSTRPSPGRAHDGSTHRAVCRRAGGRCAAPRRRRLHRRTPTPSRRRPRPATRRATSPVTGPSRPSRRPSAARRSSSRAPCSTASPWDAASARGKVLVLNVWGSWCAPCVAEAPALQKTWAGLQADKAPVEFMGIDFREDPARGAAFAKKAGRHLPEPERRVGGLHPGPAGQGTHRAHHPRARHRGADRRPGQRRHVGQHPARPRRRRRRRVVTPAAGTAAVLAAGDTVTSGALPLAVVVAALAGLVSFASPCVLPLVPGFLGYVTGLTGEPLAEKSRSTDGDRCPALRRRASPRCSCVGSIFVTTAGRALIEHRTLLMRVGGVLVILMGLVFLGVGTQREAKIAWRPRPAWPAPPCSARSSRSAGRRAPARPWPPCWSWPPPPGPAGRAAASPRRGLLPRSGAARSSSSPPGSTGPGAPRAGCAATSAASSVFGGALLVLVGLLMVTGVWEDLDTWLQTELVNGFRTVSL